MIPAVINIEKFNELLKKVDGENTVVNNQDYSGTIGNQVEQILNNLKGNNDLIKIAAIVYGVNKCFNKSVLPNGYDMCCGDNMEYIDKRELTSALCDVFGCEKEDTEYIYAIIELCEIEKYDKELQMKLINDVIDDYTSELPYDKKYLAYKVIDGVLDFWDATADTYNLSKKYIYEESFNFLEHIKDLTLDGDETNYYPYEKIMERQKDVLLKIKEIDKKAEKAEENQNSSDKRWLARTASGYDVYINKETYEHMQAHPDVKMCDIIEAIGKTTVYNGKFSIKPVGMGRIVGKDRCIKVSPENTDVKMMRRKGRNISTPCLMEGKYKPEDTSKITVGICKDEDGKDTFFTAFYGKLAPKEVNDSTLTDEERKESEEFWSNHAIVVTNDMLDPAEVFLSSIIDSIKTSLENGKDTVMIGNENLKIEKIECSDLIKVGNWVINMDSREVMSGHEKMIGDNVIKRDTPVI